MAENDVDIKINVDSKDANRALEDFGKGADKSISKVGKSFDSLKAGFGSIAAGFVSVAAAVAAVTKGINEAVDAEKSIKQLSIAIASTGEFSKQAISELTAYSQTLSDLTGIDDDVINSSLALAKTFGITNDQAKNLVTAATNLSAVTGQDLETAIRTLGGTFDGTLGKIANLGPEFRNLTTEQIKNGAAVDLINEKYQDAAATLGEGFEGSLNRVENAFNDVFKAIGNEIINDPNIINGLNLFADGLKALASVATPVARVIVDAFKDVVTVIALAGSTITSTVSSIAKFVGADSVAKQFDSITDSAFKTAETMGFFGTVAQESTSKFDNVLKKTSDNAKKSFGNVGKAAEEAAKKLKKATDDAQSFVQGIIKASGSEIEIAAKKAGENFSKIQELQSKGLISFEQAEEARISIVSEVNEKIDKLNKEAADRDAERIEKVLKAEQDAAKERAQLVLGIGQSALAGGDKEQQKKNVGNAVTAVANAFGPVIGAFGSLFSNIATLNKQQAKEFIRDFIDAAPDFVIGFVENIPEIISGIIEVLSRPSFWVRAAQAFARGVIAYITTGLGEAIYNGFLRAAPVISETLAQGAGKFITDFASSVQNLFVGIVPLFVDAFRNLFAEIGGFFTSLFGGLQNALTILTEGLGKLTLVIEPLANAITSLIDAIGSIGGGIFGSGGSGGFLGQVIGGIGGAVGSVGSALGFARGGIVPKYAANGLFVPRGTDTVPAMLTPGELVVPADKVDQVLSGGGGDDMTNAILTAILQALSQPTVVQSQVTVNQQAFADIILQLNRQNARLSA